MNLNYAVVKSIVGSTIYKLGSSVIAFISVPLLLNALGKETYGVWVTLTALVAWLNLFDFGSGYALKNKVTESIIESDKKPLQVMIAGTIQFYLLSTIIILFVFVFCLSYIKAFRENLYVTIILYLPVILAFPFTLGHFIMQGLKKFNLFNSLLLVQSFLWLLFIISIRFKISEPEMHIIAIVYSTLYVVLNFFIFFISLNFLKFEWKELLNFNHFKSSKKTLLVGGRFFILQISSLFLFSLGNIMTYNNLQSSDVAQFDTVNKLYLLGMTIFNIVITVYWSEISHAKALKDAIVLKLIQKQLILCSLIFSIVTVIVSSFIPLLINYWTNSIINVEFNQLYPFILLVCIQFFAYSGAVFLNAFEDLKGQVLLSGFAALFIVPLAKYFFYLNVGIGSVPLASAILILPSLFYVLYKSNNRINNLNKL